MSTMCLPSHISFISDILPLEKVQSSGGSYFIMFWWVAFCSNLEKGNTFNNNNNKIFNLLLEWLGWEGIISLALFTTTIVAKKWESGNLVPSRFSGKIRKVEARLGKLAKIRKVETD